LQDAKKETTTGEWENKIYGLSGSDFTDPIKQDEELKEIQNNIA